jgi:hypothetical protein
MDQNQENVNPSVIEAEIVEDKTLAWLSESELYALQYFRKKYKKDALNTPIAPDVREQLFQLYLNGKSLSEIRNLNSGFSMGQVVDAAVTGDWNVLRQEYLVTVQERAQGRLRQIACESVDFIADHIAATHKFQGDKIRKYLQTGKVEDLDGINLGSLQQYKSLIDMLVKITGNDKPGDKGPNTINISLTKQVEAPLEHSSLPPVPVSKSLAELAAAKKTQGK